MLRLALFSLLAASTACTGDIIGDMPTDPNDPPADPNDPPAEPTTEVTIRVSDRGSPVASLPVVFQAADDSVIKETTTGSDGSAVADMPNGGTVTVIRLRPDDQNGNPQAPEVFTYVGVKAGDVLDLQSPSGVTTAPTTITVRVPPNENGVATVSTPCGSGTGAPPEIPVTIDGCAPGSEIGFYVVEPGQTAFFKRAPLGTTVDLSTETYRDQLTTQISVAGTPPTDAQVTVAKRLESDGFTFYTTQPQTAPAEIATPDVPGAEQVVLAMVSGPNGAQTIAKHEPFAAAPSSLDLLADSITYTSPATVAVDGTLTWTESGPGIPDIVHAKYIIAREGMTFTRSVVAPHAGPTLRLPQLPATYDAYNAKAGDATSASHELARFSTGYDSVRARIFNARLSSVAPMGARVAVSYAAGQGETEPRK